MYKDFGRRLQRDIKRMVDDRIKAYEITSQARLAEEAQIKAKQMEVNVISHKKQRYAVWFGGSLLADTVGWDDFLNFVGKLEYVLTMFLARLTSTATATPKRNMKRRVLVLRGTTRCLGRFCSCWNRGDRFAIRFVQRLGS